MRATRRPIPILNAGLTLALLPGAVEARDAILRGHLSYVTPTASATWTAVGTAEFLDAAFPPLGRFDSIEISTLDASADLGGGLGLEIVIRDRLGFDVGLSYTRLVVEASYGGEVVYTPARGEPPMPLPDQTQAGPISGAGVGRMDQLLITLAGHVHLLRNEGLDLYAGPVVGVSAERTVFDRGEFQAVLTWVSRTPLAGREEGRARFAWGGIVGLDLPMGKRGWLASVAARYLANDSVNPSLFQVALGYRF
jgi:hypothetical protein